ncbi:MAG TPA: sterol desaturase family protein [Kaistia sp.]|jgi:sterol desaturase/sphingolipid hydroxylase (fatty acid hydroxylase superfamily)|nr:sterol desaturase family protein [Kaistia sp.]
MSVELNDVATRTRQNVESVLGGAGFEHLWHVWLFASCFLGLALVGWWLHEREGGRRGVRGFLGFLFPARVYRHPSSWSDIKLSIINQVASPASFALAAYLGGWLASATSWTLTQVFDWNADFNWGIVSIAALTLCLALVSDFATYVVHRLHHTVPALWEIHKVHHSAEVLSPLTVMRKHPVFDLLSRGLKALLVGPLQGVVFFLFAGPVDVLTAVGANLVFGLYHMFGAGLRHSHVRLSYGPRVEHVLISPAQHQIHHSRARRHWDRNFGQIFALWDWAFGTLYVPVRREHLEFGIDGVPATDHAGLVTGCFRPMANAVRVALGGTPCTGDSAPRSDRCPGNAAGWPQGEALVEARSAPRRLGEGWTGAAVSVRRSGSEPGQGPQHHIR